MSLIVFLICFGFVWFVLFKAFFLFFLMWLSLSDSFESLEYFAGYVYYILISLFLNQKFLDFFFREFKSKPF